MGDAHPRISIGMPIFNAEGQLAEAIESILAQTFRDFDLIICDNASTDRTEAICRDFAARDSRIRYFRNQANVGAAGNFNLAFEHARGEFFKWMAHDDVIAPTYLERCLAIYEEEPDDVVLVFPRRSYMTHDGRAVEGEPDLIGSGGLASFDRIDFRRLAGLCSSRCPIFVFGLMPRAVVASTLLMGNYPSADLVFVGEMNMRGVFREVPEDLFTQRLHLTTPDLLARMTKKGDAAWFDPRNQRKTRIHIERTLLLEFARAVWRAPLSRMEKLGHLWHLRRHIAFRARRKASLTVRRSRKRRWKSWTRTTVAAARLSARSFLPLRLWVLLSALRGDLKALSLALSGAERGSHPGLLDFAATNLARHGDPEAEAVLDEWIERGDRAWWWSALKVRSATARPGEWTSRPILSVRMIVGNAAPHLEDALESLLRQGLTDFELILERSGASDAAVRCIEAFAARDCRIRATTPDVGHSAARAEVLQAAGGKYYVEMDQADVVHPDRFLAQIAYLEAHPNCVAVSCQMLPIDERGAALLLSPPEPDTFELAAALFVREALITPRDPLIDIEGQLDAAALGEISTLPRILHRRRRMDCDD